VKAIKDKGGTITSAQDILETNDCGTGVAIANYDSVASGHKIVQQVIKEFGRIDVSLPLSLCIAFPAFLRPQHYQVLINNAGILRDKSFKAMTDQQWEDVHQVHVKGAFSVTHACWPIFR